MAVISQNKVLVATMIIVLSLLMGNFKFANCINMNDLDNDDAEVIEVVYSVVSGSAHLPCNIRPIMEKGDGARLVLWYKDDGVQPVYSFDNRYQTPKHWSQAPSFGPRAFFRDSIEPAQLIVSSVTMEDAGFYKCRVDFKQGPTVTRTIQLKIIEEPKKPIIMDSEGSAVMGTVGPFRLKQALILVCLVEGGLPKPDVIWYRDGVSWDEDIDPSTYEEVLQNTLVISELDRAYHDSVFECRAINNNVTKAPMSRVSILVEMPILSMTIASLPDPVTADITYQVLCQITGAQPPPEVKWFLDSYELPSELPRLTHENNLTTSQLVFTPKLRDQGKTLTCVADNEVFPSVNRSSILNIYFLPVVHVELESRLDPSNIQEGDSITFKCLIQAHPWIWRILWYRDGEELVPSDRVIIDEQQLILKNASKSMSGQYVCSAANVEGDGFSKALKIAINYRPVCVAPTIQKKENGIDLICQVDSKPKSMTYRWLFNSTDTTFEIPSAESTMFFNNYKSSTDEDHGQVLCWASNSLGEQVNPCVFHVVPLSSPQSPKNCKVSNYSTSTVEVKCQSGFSGGLNQRFIMEVFETVNNSQVLVATNWTDLEFGNNEPVFLGVWGLLPDSDYIISVKASNERGESSAVYVGGSTRLTDSGATWLPIAGSEDESDSRKPLLFVIVGILVTLMILGALLTAILAVRRRRLSKLNQIEIQSGSGASSGNSSPPVNAELQEALIKPDNHDSRQAKMTTIQRKVSFRDTPQLTSTCPECEVQMEDQNGSATRSWSPAHGHAGGSFSQSSTSILPPVQRAVVRTFSIDKMRPLCPVCNPIGETPYPDDNIPKHPHNHFNNGTITTKDNNANKRSIESPEDEVRRLNSELDELQQCLQEGLDGLNQY